MNKSALIIAILLCSGLTGCISNSSDDEFDWPDPSDLGCKFLDEYSLDCNTYIEGLETPHQSIINPENGELWIIYLNGFVKSWNGTKLTEVADLTSIISRCHMEQGLLGMVFDEDYISSRLVLLSYVEDGNCEGPNNSDLILASALIGDNGVLDISSISILRNIEQPYRNHNGGHLLEIGNNQYLWGVGDGGSANDPQANGQNTSNPLGAIHLFSFQNNEISPVMNNSEIDPYVLHYGLRNPWRFSLDSNNMLWVADVGQNCWEEVNLVSLTNVSNLGWSIREGFQEFNANEDCSDIKSEPVENMTDPIVTYSHQNGNCSITGGFWMDWGPESLHDGYLYGDFCSGSIWLLKEVDGEWLDHYIGSSGGMIVGFGRGMGDELLVFHWTGDIALIK